jgi:hypothetical protein
VRKLHLGWLDTSRNTIKSLATRYENEESGIAKRAAESRNSRKKNCSGKQGCALLVLSANLVLAIYAGRTRRCEDYLQKRCNAIGRMRKEIMDTDEYEISLAREINVCKRVIKEAESKLAARVQRFGMDFPQVAQAVAEGRLMIDQRELGAWSDDFEALPQWRQRLEQYYEALALMRVSAS